MNPPPPAARIAAPLVVFAVMVALLLPAHWPAIQNATWESGDMAANSLLIQDAKSFHLLVGNYSRVGFNHPGPALLYVLAAGEMVFHDWLKLTPYPMGGQMIGVIFFSATWAGVIWTILRRLAESALTASLYLALFLLVTALTAPRAFVWLWPPDLYYFPFAAFTLALGELVAGKNKSLLALAVSWGFLLNGHASFFGITAVMIVTAVAANRALSAYSKTPPVSLLSSEFLRGSRARLAIAFAILLLFLTPIAIQTVIHYPGPFADYMTYSHGHSWNNPVASFRFVAHYWGGFVGFLLGMAVIVKVCRFEWNQADALPNLSLAAGILAATIAVLFYAVVGVDDIDADYIGIFYRSTPAFTAVLLAHVIYHQFFWNPTAKPDLFVVPLAILFCLSLIYDNVEQTPGNDCHREFPELLAKMKTLGKMPIVVDLDGSNCEGNDWGPVWGRMVGLESYAKRQGVLPFVIRRNWQILFTKQARYQGHDVPPGDRYFVSSADLPDATFRFFGLSFYKIGSFSISPGQSFSVAADKDKPIFNRYFLDSGWSFPETNFVWSQEKETHLLLPFPTQEARTVYLDMGAFLPGENETQHIEVTADGVPVGDATFRAHDDPGHQIDRSLHYFNLPAGLREPIDLRITIDRPRTPHSVDYFSTDTRLLGVSLYGFGVK